MACSCVIFASEVAPALSVFCVSVPSSGKSTPRGYTHNTPILMAITTPIFSFLFSDNVRIIFHGSKARKMSIAPENAAFHRISFGVYAFGRS